MNARRWIFATALSLLAIGPLFGVTLPALGPEVRVSLSNSDVQWNPKVAVFPDAGFVVAWNAQGRAGTGRNAIVVHARFFGADSTPTSGEFLLGVAGTGPTLDGVAPIGNNRFVVAWDDAGAQETRVMIQIFNRSGKAVTGALQVHANSPQSRYFGVLSTGANGDIAVGWAADITQGTNFRNDAYTRVFSKTLTPLTGEMLTATGSYSDSSGPFPDSIALAPDGSLAMALTYAGDGVSVFATRMARDGSHLPLSDLYPPDACCILNTYDSSLAMAGDGSFLVAWDSMRPAENTALPPLTPPSPIVGRLFAADGTAQGNEVITINRRQVGQLTAPVAAALPGGGFVAAWQDETGRDGSGFGIFGRLLAADGTPAWRDFQIDATASGAQVQPAIASGPGGAVVVWLSDAATTVYARRVNAIL